MQLVNDPTHKQAFFDSKMQEKAAPIQPETWKVLPSPAAADRIHDLIAMHAEMREANSYCYFELAYARRTNWMEFICDKPAGGMIGTPEFGEG